jgi:hypothetical protein
MSECRKLPSPTLFLRHGADRSATGKVCNAAGFSYFRGVRLLLLAACAYLLAGCASFRTHVEPRADLSQIERFWVERNLADNRAVGVKLVRALEAHGKQAEVGPLTMMPRETQAILSFRDHWTWDFREHLTGLEVTVREPRTRRLLARARFEGPLALHLNEFDVIDRVIRDLLAPRPVEAAAPATASAGSS